MVRREFIKGVLSALAIAGPVERGAREIVRSGELGEVRFCRMAGTEGQGREMLAFVQFVLGPARPLSVESQGAAETMRATFRYPAFVASYERTGAGEDGIWFYGSEGTLRVNGNGLRLWTADGRLRRK
jgi:hypothetical protein